MKKIISFAFLVLIALILISIRPTPASAPLYSYVDHQIPENKKGISTTTDYREDELDSYLSRLAWSYECTGRCRTAVITDEPFRIVDSNGKYSYGCFQFQEATWLSMARRHGIDPWENGGIYNCDQQWKVARAMFLEDPEQAAGHWYMSIYVRGLGLPNIK